MPACTCNSKHLCGDFLSEMEGLLRNLRSQGHAATGHTEGRDCLCPMPATCGPSVWAVLHGAAKAMRDKVCPSCGTEAVRLLRGLHDVVNVRLEKKVMYPADLKHLNLMTHRAMEKTGLLTWDLGVWKKKQAQGSVAEPTSLHQMAAALPFGATERLYAAYLDGKGAVLEISHAAVGDSRSAPVPMAAIFRKAHELGALAFALIHNHPSGNPNASAEDLAATMIARREGAVHGLKLADHLVVAGGKAYSIA